MAKTELTRKIEASLSSWSTTKLGGVKLNAMRKGFCAIEVPVECGSVKGGLVDFIRVDECLLNEREAGGCSFAAYRQCDEKGYAATVKEFADEAGCPKDTSDYKFRLFPCEKEDCRHYYKGTTADNDILVTCVEIKISVSDFASKHGHNFVGNCNYYAMPTDLYAKVKDRVPEGIGVLLYMSNGLIRKKVECEYHELSDTTQKWLVLSTIKRQIKQADMRSKEKCVRCKKEKNMRAKVMSY